MRGIRKVLLKVMLGVLGLGAAAGALAFLVADRDFSGRIVGTAAVAATAAGLLMLASLMIDRPTAQTAGVLAAGVIVLEFIGAIFLIWFDWSFRNQGWYHLEADVGLTMLALAGVTPVAMAFLIAAAHRAAAWCGRVGVAVSALTLACWFVAIWLDYHQWHFDETGWTLAGFGATAALALLGFHSGDRRYWRWVGVLASMAAAASSIAHI
jgi:hypothetical protein